MKEKYIKITNLSISGKLLNFVNNELLPGEIYPFGET